MRMRVASACMRARGFLLVSRTEARFRSPTESESEIIRRLSVARTTASSSWIPIENERLVYIATDARFVCPIDYRERNVEG